MTKVSVKDELITSIKDLYTTFLLLKNTMEVDDDKDEVLVYHHNDLDGAVSAAAIIAKFHEKVTYEKVRFVEVDYKSDLSKVDISKVKEIYIVDFSLNECHIKQLMSMDIQVPIVWIDHHTSSFDMLHKYSTWLIEHAATLIHVEHEISAALLCYLYSLEASCTDALGSYIDEEDSGPNNTAICIPSIIYHTSMYDTFSDKMSLDFYYGIQAEDYKPATYEGYQFLAEYITTFDDVDKLIENGKVIYRYIKESNKLYQEKQAFHIMIEDETSGEQFKVIAMNRFANSIVFGDLVNEADGLMIYYQKSDLLWSYSIYKGKGPNSDKIDCADLAKRIGGGGGRKECAGFNIGINIFVNEPKEWLRERKIKIYYRTPNVHAYIDLDNQ